MYRENPLKQISKIFELASLSAEKDVKKARLLGNKEKSEDLFFKISGEQNLAT